VARVVRELRSGRSAAESEVQLLAARHGAELDPAQVENLAAAIEGKP
jgi:hypothetical protein